MNLPLDFDSAEPWTRIVKIALTIAAVYVIAVVGLFVRGNFLGGAVLLVFGLAFSAVLRRARRASMGAAGRLTASAVTVHPVRVWGCSLNVASGQTTPAAPSGATARCRDGTYSFSAHRSGTCSHHDGVSAWLTDAQQVPDTALPMYGGSCGVERWTVKTLSDSSAGTVDLSDT